MSSRGSRQFLTGQKQKIPGTKTRVPEIYPGGAIVGPALGRNNRLAGWGLRCGDDGSVWSRGKLPNPSKPRLLAHPDPVSRPGFRFARRLNRLELVLRPNQCAVSISRAKAFEILPREEVPRGD